MGCSGSSRRLAPRRLIHGAERDDRPGGARPRLLAAALIAGQLSLALAGCVSVRTVGSREARDDAGGVAVTVYASDSTRRARRPGPSGVMGELERRDGSRWVPVFRSLDPQWVVAGLVPGTYRVSFPARLDDAGNVERISGAVEQVKVRAGRITQVETTLDHVPTALVVVGVVTVVAAAIVISKYLQDHDLPLPPPPPPDLVEAVFYVSLDLSMGGEWSSVSDRLPPQVTSHFPAARAIVAARRPRIVFALSEPPRAEAVEGSAVSVLSERSGLIPGTVSVDTGRWWIIWEPRTDLEPGDTVHVTLAAGSVEDRAGNELAKPVSFSFRTAPR